MCENQCNITHVVNHVHKTQVNLYVFFENVSNMFEHMQKPMQICTFCQACAQNLSKLTCFPKVCKTHSNTCENQCNITHVVNHVHKTEANDMFSETCVKRVRKCAKIFVQIAHVVNNVN